MMIVLLGAPGAGKGTQATAIAGRRGWQRLSTGDLLRDAVRRGEELGRRAQAYMERGTLVPDEVILGLVRDVLAAGGIDRGWILDGFPRTVAQAEGLEGILSGWGRSVDRVIHIEVPEEEVVRRIAGRRHCSRCGKLFNVHTDPPQREGVCDACGGSLILRADDAEETVRRRLTVYREETLPLLDFYEKRGALRRVPGGGSPQEVERAIEAALGDGAR